MALMTLTEKYRTDLLALVDRYKAISGKADSSVSLGAFPSDSEFVRRLRRDKNFTIYKAKNLENYIEQRFDEIRRQLAPGADSLHLSQEIFPIPQEEGEHPSPGGSEEGGPLSEEDRARNWARGIKSFNSI